MNLFYFHSSIHMKNTEKRQNTDWILKQLLEESSVTEKKGHLFLKFWKISELKMSFTDVEFHEQNLPFEAMLSNITIFFYGKNEKIWIYLHYTHFT